MAPFEHLSYYRMNETYYDWYYEYDEFGNLLDWREELKLMQVLKLFRQGIISWELNIFFLM